MLEHDLRSLALRYAARDLSPDELTAFEQQLGTDQAARDALSDVMRLSAQAIGQDPPKPQAACRALLRARLNWANYRGHPLFWVSLGGIAMAACALIVVALADRADPRTPTNAPAMQAKEQAPAPREKGDPHTEPGDGHAAFVSNDDTHATHCAPDSRSVAEIWADLSTPEHVERTRDEEARLRLKMQSLAHPHHAHAPHKLDSPQP